MKFLKPILLALLGLAALILVLGLIAPKTAELERSIVVQASPAEVFPHIRYFEKSKNWSPWNQLDPNMQIAITGQDGETGAKSAWSGNKDVGKGEQVITGLKENEEMTVRVAFQEPFESEADTYFRLKDMGDGQTEVSWGFSSKMPFPFNIMGLFMDIGNAVGKDYEKGLANLKAIVEQEASSTGNAGDYPVTLSELPERYVVAIREQLPFSEVEKQTGAGLEKVRRALASKGIQALGPACSLTYSWDEKAQRADIAFGYFVSRPVDLGTGFTTFTLPAGTKLVVDYYGPYSGIGPAHLAIEAYANANQIKAGAPAMEEYLTGPGTEPDTAKWFTRVIYPIAR